MGEVGGATKYDAIAVLSKPIINVVALNERNVVKFIHKVICILLINILERFLFIYKFNL